MAEGVLMPKEGITVESCIIGEWKKNVGDHVNVGDILFTYETDKAEFECESTASGTLLENSMKTATRFRAWSMSAPSATPARIPPR